MPGGHAFGFILMQRLLAVVAERLQATRLQLLDMYSPVAGAAGSVTGRRPRRRVGLRHPHLRSSFAARSRLPRAIQERTLQRGRESRRLQS